MEKKHIISLTGDLASGKGETSRILIEKLGYGIYRNGQYFRKLAKEMNMSVTEFNIYVEDHPEIDKQIEIVLQNMPKHMIILLLMQDLAGMQFQNLLKFTLKLMWMLRPKGHSMIQTEKTRKVLKL